MKTVLGGLVCTIAYLAPLLALAGPEKPGDRRPAARLESADGEVDRAGISIREVGVSTAAVAAFKPAQPFAQLELLRLDYRSNGPITEQTLLVSPGAPLPFFDRATAALLFLYRHDVLTASHAGRLAIPTGLHRFELGVPMS
ncbi:MAG: hypothetical protein AAF449_16900, partial [Myxococcota bacterium]